jgi:hypothetical protein
MPDVVGLTVTAAQREIQRAATDSGVATVNVTVDLTFEKGAAGTIDSSRPAAGGLVGGDAEVALTLALSPMPDLVGEQAGPAVRRLKKLDYEVRIRGKILPDEKPDTIMAQLPKPGAQPVPGQDRIVLTVAKPQPGTFISVTGTGSALVTWIDEDFSTHQMTVSLPFTRRVGSVDISLSAQRQLGDSGSITCAIIDWGAVWKKATSSGPYSICSVVG